MDPRLHGDDDLLLKQYLIETLNRIFLKQIYR